MQFYRDLQDGEIIQAGDRILTAEAGFQPVRTFVGKAHSTRNNFIIQRPINLAKDIEIDFPVAVDFPEQIKEHSADDPVSWTVQFNPPPLAPARPDTEIVAQIIKSIQWNGIRPDESADMLRLLMDKKTIGDVSEIIERNTQAVTLVQADSYRATFNTDCLLKILSGLVNELREKDKVKNPWWKFWSK